jgi:hypothetical protein
MYNGYFRGVPRVAAVDRFENIIIFFTLGYFKLFACLII